MYIFSAVLLIAILVFIHNRSLYCSEDVWCSLLDSVCGIWKESMGFSIWGNRLSHIICSFCGGYVRMSGADPFGDGDEDDHWLVDQNAGIYAETCWKASSNYCCRAPRSICYCLLLPLLHCLWQESRSPHL